MYKNTIKALEVVLKEEYDKKDPVSSLSGLSLGNQLIIAETGETIIYQKDPAKYFYLLLSGRTVIMNQISWSIDDIIDYVEPPHILGLMEFLMKVPSYTSFVVAESKCVLLRVSAEDFIKLIQHNNDLCYYTLLILGKVANNNMERAETHRMFPARDILGHYLYTQAQHFLPYICPLTRKDLSDKLTINLRSLYRYLDHMQEKGYIVLKRGKIVIDKEHFKKLADRYGEVIL
ncbi:MAG TPA: hypothetical protein DIW17_05875 [Clostridiales bacterium]|jgi:CRP-like cAMP-binding protein|uniref:Crp/Fnr family transcriptional regulator n=1 Tax=Muricomes intestini TaxID=1796634 RepID=UPI000E91C447|nr:hypothetical protein [Lachnospiraceae bacterium]HCS73387.1 hypothetical protein [Clostridiales bacterium]